ncbi:MAG TPA: phosphate regulon sensor histidine kinase PhoR [Candidatus Tenderia sp.]|nr:phosphate regulon sensor histidine kinase PhoR [Candidatus Tenderia sp.]
MNNPWTTELWRLTAVIALALLAGSLAQATTLFLIIALSLYIFWHLYHLRQLYNWLNAKGKFHPPTGRGLWREVFDQLYHLQKRNRSRKKKLARFLNRFQESTAAMPDATVVLDAQWQIQWINSAARDLLGLRPKKDAGQYITNLLRQPAFKHYIEQAAFQQPLEIHAPADDTVQLSIRIIPYGKKQHLLVARDITRLTQLEQVRRDFVANISHELRTPLTVLNGYLETMQDDDDPALAPWQPSLNQMHQQTERMKNIVNDLLMLSRLESGTSHHSATVYMAAMLTTIREDAIALSGDKKQTITLDADPGLQLKGSEGELHSAFSNLVFNAVHYTPSGGHITIRWHKDKQGAHFEVSDDGIGIPPQNIPRLTERFYRVDAGRSRDEGGTGLGLAIVKHVLQRHQATLLIKSTVNKGSTFSCRFPASTVVQIQPREND